MKGKIIFLLDAVTNLSQTAMQMVRTRRSKRSVNCKARANWLLPILCTVILAEE